MQVIGVVGAGQMGAGIAQVAAAAGLDVRLSDIDLPAATAARERIGKALARQVERGKLAGDAAEMAMAHIAAVAGPEAMAGADLVIEAATEREEVKARIFAGIAPHLGTTAILASNTSSIPITRMAAGVPDPARFIGVHFFNPVPAMALVELIRGLATSDETVARVRGFAARIGKTVVEAQDSPGFVVNRILLPMLNEACFVLGEGVAGIADIDAGCRLGLNHPMGPLALADFIGLDTCLAITQVLLQSTGDPKFRPAPLLVKYVEAGWLGRKSGRGFYDYGGKEPVPTR